MIKRHNNNQLKDFIMSKLQAAIDIVKGQTDKKAALSLIQETLGVTRANASVYLFKANKALGLTLTEVPVEVKPEVVAVATPTREYSELERSEYTANMAERTLQDLSLMSIDEYFEMKQNLMALA